MPGTFDTTRDFSRFAFRMGSARTRSATQGSLHPGPRPFAPGTVTGATAATKIAHALMAALLNRDAMRQEATVKEEKAKADEYEHGLRVKKLEQDVAPEDLGAVQAKSFAQHAGVEQANRQYGPLKLKGPTPPDVLKAWPGAPTEMTLDEMKAAREIYAPKPPKHRVSIPGVPYPVEEGTELYNAYYRDRAGLGRSETFDAVSEAERDAERGAASAYDNVLATVKAEKLADPKSGVDWTQMASGAMPAAISEDPRVKQAAASIASARARNIGLALGRAKDASGIITALSRFYPGDHALADTTVAGMRKKAVLKAASLAQGSEVDRLIRLTEDPADPLNKDPEVRAALGLY